MKKRIFSYMLLFGLLLSCIQIPLQASSGNWQGTEQGFQSFYNFIPDDKRWIILTALAAISAIPLYKLYSRYKSQQEDRATRQAGKRIYGFEDKDNFSLLPNASNIAKFINIAKNDDQEGALSDEDKILVTPERLFKAYVYPVLEGRSHHIPDISSQTDHSGFWDKIIDEIATKGFQLDRHTNYNLGDLKKHLEKYIENNNSPTAQKILNSMNQYDSSVSNQQSSTDIEGFVAANRNQYNAPENLDNLAEYISRRYNNNWPQHEIQPKIFADYIYPVLAANYMERIQDSNKWIDLIQQTRKTHGFLQDESVKDRDLVGELKTDLQEYMGKNLLSPTDFSEPSQIWESMEENLKMIAKPGFGPPHKR